MVPCPACQQVAFQAGVCRSCGFRVVTGRRDAPVEAPLMELPADALVEVLEPDGPSLLDFESTALVAEAPAPAALEVRDLASCPRCRAALPSPMPTLCDTCGLRLRPRAKKAAAVADDGTRLCTECGIPNAADRSTCLNCGSRMAT